MDGYTVLYGRTPPGGPVHMGKMFVGPIAVQEGAKSGGRRGKKDERPLETLAIANGETEGPSGAGRGGGRIIARAEDADALGGSTGLIISWIYEIYENIVPHLGNYPEFEMSKDITIFVTIKILNCFILSLVYNCFNYLLYTG